MSMPGSKKLQKWICVLLFLCLTLAQNGCAADSAAFADAAEYFRLPVLMYHSILQDPARAGNYVVSPETLEADLRYLRERGYESVVVADLIAYTEGRGDLPDKPVMITLDDGYYNNLLYVLPILEALDMRAVVSVIGVYTELYSEKPDPNPNYAHLSFADIRALQATGRVEIQNHSYDFHKQEARAGSKRKSGEGQAAYRSLFCADTMKLQTLLDKNCGVVATAYAYPYGQISPESREYLRELGFCATLTCYERCNTITRDPDCLFGLGRYNRPACLTTEEYMEKLLQDAGG